MLPVVGMTLRRRHAVEGSNFMTHLGQQCSDTIYGRGGADFLSGGTGADAFPSMQRQILHCQSDTITILHGSAYRHVAITGITASHD